MNYLVKITRDDDGDYIDDPVWCAVIHAADADCALCTLEVFGAGEGAAEYETKTVKRGGITCSRCLERIHEIKSIKL